MDLLTINQTKLLKSQHQGYLTAGLQLEPGNKHTCPTACSLNLACRKTCLKYAGRNRFRQDVRKARTELLLKHPERFWWQLNQETAAFCRKAEREHLKPAMRLNCLSDIPFENTEYGRGYLKAYKDIQFYDYTKDLARYFEFIGRDQSGSEWPPNYHLTLSWHEKMKASAIKFCLSYGGNLAVVFVGQIPDSFFGFPVVSGDHHDLRFQDKPGTIIGLKYKLSISPRTGKAIRPNPKSNPGFVYTEE